MNTYGPEHEVGLGCLVAIGVLFFASLFGWAAFQGWER